MFAYILELERQARAAREPEPPQQPPPEPPGDDELIDLGENEPEGE